MQSCMIGAGIGMVVIRNALLAVVLLLAKCCGLGFVASVHCVAGTALVGCKTVHSGIACMCW